MLDTMAIQPLLSSMIGSLNIVRQNKMRSVPKGLLHTRQQLVHEYKELQKLDRETYAREKKISNHRSENRYSDVVPYESTSVKLQYPTKYTVDGYINASFVSPSPDRKTGHRYIASQGPLENTVGTFWQCALEELFLHNHKIVNVIMLTELREGHHEKCFDYVKSIETDVPNVVHNLFGLDMGKVAFKGLQVLKEGGVELREFTISLGESSHQDKILRHVWVREWPDFGVPNRLGDNNEYVIKYLSELDEHIIENPRIEKSSIVHCSAGVGRSGTFIAMDWYYNDVFKRHDVRLENQEDIVFNCVANLRRCRVMMVQRFEQYEYLYQALQDFYDGE